MESSALQPLFLKRAQKRCGRPLNWLNPMLTSPPVRKKRLLVVVLLVTSVLVLSGCQTVHYYSQAVGGQLEIFRAQRPVTEVLDDAQAPAKLKQRLRTVQEIREFARTDLDLDPDDHYVRYADLHRPYVVWNVHAAPEFSMEPKAWWYPFVGKAKYRGYFSETDALEYADRLRRKGFDVYVEGVEAYSTLGWFKDPLLNTFIDNSEPNLAETIFHELSHQRVFISGDTDFNEAFATTVGEEGVQRWLHAKARENSVEKYLQSRERKEQFVALVQNARKKLKALYGQQDGQTPAPVKDAEELRRQKQELIAELRQDYEQLKRQWGGYSGYDRWFSGPLNNAQLNTVSAYYDLVPAFQALLRENGGNLEKFYAAVEKLGKLSKKERRHKLESLEPTASGG